MMGQDWCILRTNSSNTLTLAKSLTEDGYEAWSPAEVVELHARRSFKAERVERPLTPSFVFARADRLYDLAALARSPALQYRVWDRELRRMVTHGHPRFSVFKQMGCYSMIPDAALSALRRAERRTAPKPVARVFAVGDRVKVPDGAFTGLVGVVQQSGPKFSTVLFEGFGAAILVATKLLDDESPHSVNERLQAPIAEAA